MRIKTSFVVVLGLCAGFAVGAAEKKADTKKPGGKYGPKWQKVLPQTPPGYTCTTNLVAAYPEHNVELVIYAPDKPGSYPCVLDIHGGGWTA
ncbi:MAG TPA: alpha/beta hydrolase, partial [Verrucomicrobiae bacterium]